VLSSWLLMTTRLMQYITHISLCIAAYKGDNNAVLVSALVAIHSVHLNILCVCVCVCACVWVGGVCVCVCVCMCVCEYT